MAVILIQGQCLGAFSKCVGYLVIVTMTWERVAKGSCSGFCKKLLFCIGSIRGFPGGSVVKNLPALQGPLETWV